MTKDRKELFRSDLRRALGLLRIKVDASATGLDEDYVNRLIGSACIWLSGRVTTNFDPRDWSELRPYKLRQLEEYVKQFDQIAATVNPCDEVTGKVRSVPATAKQWAEAEKSLWAIARIIGEDTLSLVRGYPESRVFGLRTPEKHGRF